MHLFDADGNHLKSEARHAPYDIEGWDAACEKAEAERSAMFIPWRGKKPQRCDISVKLFSVVIDGIAHGLICRAEQPEEDGTVFEGVFLEPRDVMFHPPWDSGQWSDVVRPNNALQQTGHATHGAPSHDAAPA